MAIQDMTPDERLMAAVAILRDAVEELMAMEQEQEQAA